MSTKLFLSIAIRALLFLRMTSHGFSLSSTNNNNAILLQQSIKQPLKPLFVTSSISSLSSSLPNYQQQHDDDDDLNIIESSTLRKLYPKLVAWKKEYGNPNIPLNIEGGRQCQLLRRLHIQQKLRPNEIELLEHLDFNFQISLEDLYYEADFEDMYVRLAEYQRLYPNDPVTKKYRPDPELGAWATGLRRLGTEAVQPEHVRMLNAINFNWKSKRACGSKFMLEYRDIQDKVRLYGRDYLDTEDVQKWISKERSNRLNDKMNDTRYHYMVELIGTNWMEEE